MFNIEQKFNHSKEVKSGKTGKYPMRNNLFLKMNLNT